MLDVLLNTAIFIQLNRGNLIQVTGVPVSKRVYNRQQIKNANPEAASALAVGLYKPPQQQDGSNPNGGDALSSPALSSASAVQRTNPTTGAGASIDANAVRKQLPQIITATRQSVYCERRIFYSADPRDKLPASHLLVKLSTPNQKQQFKPSTPSGGT